MRKSFVFIFVLLMAGSVCSQPIDSLNYGPEPAGGISALALHYFKINFTKSQRSKLDGYPLELIYSIDITGKAKLEKVNGVNDPAIIDSLFRVTQYLPNFQPQIMDGKVINSMYFFSILFPTYRNMKPVGGNGLPLLSLEDIEYIETRGAIEILLGGVFNMFGGNASDYLKPGGGFKVDMLFKGKNGLGIGLDMSFYGNTRKQDYPISSTRMQNEAPPTLMIGLAFNKMKLVNKRQYYSFQLETNYVIQNVTPKIDNYDKDFTQFKGFSPGFIFNYGIQLGKDKLIIQYHGLGLANHWMNFHAGFRPLFYDFNTANGIMIEFGISYRLISSFISNYKLKQ